MDSDYYPLENMDMSPVSFAERFRFGYAFLGANASYQHAYASKICALFCIFWFCGCYFLGAETHLFYARKDGIGI